MANALGQSIGMGYVRDGEVLTKDEVIMSKYELEVAAVRVKAEVALTALPDPKMAKVKG
jgi:sarcosine dehydrogenase